MLQKQLTSPVALNLADDERWQAIQRIIDSPRFNKSPRLSRLLRYLAEHTLLDAPAPLSEHVIAIDVFERDSSFDPAVDTIVRSHMVRLRQKLDRYSEESQADAAVRVSIPKGEYAVRFDWLSPLPVAMDQEVAESEGASSIQAFRSSTRPLFLLNCFSSFLLLLGASIFLFRQVHHSPINSAAPAQPRHPLWSRLFEPNRPTTFIAADSGLVLLHRMTAKSTTLAEYLARDFSQETRDLSPERAAEVENMADRRYTSFVDMNLFHGLERLPEASTGLELRYARDLHMDDLKHGNFIFSGARGANPWLELYESGMNFIGSSNGHAYTFINRHPLSGEQADYSVTENGPNRRVLGVLAFLSNLNGDGNVLIIEGDSMAGTEAISDFALDDSALLPFLAKVRKPDGSLSHFEVLLESHSVNGSAGPFRILAYRKCP